MSSHRPQNVVLERRLSFLSQIASQCWCLLSLPISSCDDSLKVLHLKSTLILMIHLGRDMLFLLRSFQSTLDSEIHAQIDSFRCLFLSFCAAFTLRTRLTLKNKRNAEASMAMSPEEKLPVATEMWDNDIRYVFMT